MHQSGYFFKDNNCSCNGYTLYLNNCDYFIDHNLYHNYCVILVNITLYIIMAVL